MTDFGIFASVTVACVTLLFGWLLRDANKALRQQRQRDDAVRYDLTFAYLTAMRRVYRVEGRPQTPPAPEDMQHEFPA